MVPEVIFIDISLELLNIIKSIAYLINIKTSKSFVEIFYH